MPWRGLGNVVPQVFQTRCQFALILWLSVMELSGAEFIDHHRDTRLRAPAASALVHIAQLGLVGFGAPRGAGAGAGALPQIITVVVADQVNVVRYLYRLSCVRASV